MRYEIALVTAAYFRELLGKKQGVLYEDHQAGDCHMVKGGSRESKLSHFLCFPCRCSVKIYNLHQFTYFVCKVTMITLVFFSPYSYHSKPTAQETNFQVWFTGKPSVVFFFPFRSGPSFPELPYTRRQRATEALLRGGAKQSKFKVESATEMKVYVFIYIYIITYISLYIVIMFVFTHIIQ